MAEVAVVNIAKFRKGSTAARAVWDRQSLIDMITGTLQAEFSEVVSKYLPGVQKDEFGMVRDADVDMHLRIAVEVFFSRIGGLPERMTPNKEHVDG